ncbi:MAG: WYL domain-containing protein [Acidobacteria bacterium]|nr:WYL domain-containing protein [Acidobacteriota bacterium]
MKVIDDGTRRRRSFMSGLNRVVAIHNEIANGGFPRVEDLAKQLSVSPRTIKRDLDNMRNSMNAPILYDRRKKGFRYTGLGWTLPLQKLSEGELLAFFIAERALKSIGQSIQADVLKTALSKLASLLPDEVSVNIASLTESISYEERPIVNVEPQKLRTVTCAAMYCESIEFSYFSPHKQEISRRRADVYLVHNYAGDWYAISYDHAAKDFRDFHVGRMNDIKPSGKFFQPQKNWNKEDYLRRGFSMTRGGRLTKVGIVFDSYQAQWIRERQKFHPDETREELPDGSLRIRFKIGEAGLEAVARFCLQYAGNCVAEEPTKLREIIRKKLERSIRQYDST